MQTESRLFCLFHKLFSNINVVKDGDVDPDLRSDLSAGKYGAWGPARYLFKSGG